VLLTIAERFRATLVPFLLIGTIVIVLLLIILVSQRLIRAAAESRRKTLLERYRPRITAAVASESPEAIDAASAIPARHLPIAADIVLGILRLVRGGQNDRARAIAEQLSLNERWREQLQSRLWWRRSEAALALGLLRDFQSVPQLTPLLDDEHEQVRAAVIDALGQIGDREAIPALLARLADPTRHERARLVQALRAFGEDATRALVAHGERQESDRAIVATVLSFVGGTAASEALLRWSTSPHAELRAAVWAAFATIGLDDRTFYHALKALNADEPAVRAAAARALSRSGRADAAPHLAGKLDDEWEVAAHSARALARLGPDGQAALKSRVESGEGLGRDLARQVLWESGHR
jgi:HEAT repeat protein